MITRFFRRLTDRPGRLASSPAEAAPATPSDAPRADDTAAHEALVESQGPTLDVAELERVFVAWVFDLPEAAEDARPRDGAEAAFEQLEGIAHRFDVRRMPRLPALVPQLLAMLRRDDGDADDLAALLARDPTLAGDVMRVASSAFHRRAQAPSGLPQAVAVLGGDGLRRVVLGSVMRPILRGDASHPGFAAAARLWSVNEARAWLCGRLSQGDAGEAQLAGIVAGTGIAALSRMAPPVLLGDAATDPAFTHRLLAIAQPLALRAAQHWQLSGTVLDALRDDAGTPLARTLKAADRLAMGYRLIEAGCIPADARWASGIDSIDDAATRRTLFSPMAREIEALAAE